MIECSLPTQKVGLTLTLRFRSLLIWLCVAASCAEVLGRAVVVVVLLLLVYYIYSKSMLIVFNSC